MSLRGFRSSSGHRYYRTRRSGSDPAPGDQLRTGSLPGDPSKQALEVSWWKLPMPGVLTRIAQRASVPAVPPLSPAAAREDPRQTAEALALAREVLHSVEQFV